MEPVQTHQYFTAAVQRLRAAGVESAENDASLIFESVLEKPRYLWEKELSARQFSQLEEHLNRRTAREPLAYILGKMWFYGLELKARPGVFCVRPETELLVETALTWVHDQKLTAGTLLDLCTGSGAIALALAAHLPKWQVTALELSPTALETAQENAAQLELDVNFQTGDATVYQPNWAQGFQLVVSNPPYVPVRELPKETSYEPAAAFWGGGEAGMEIPAKIIANAYRYLKPGGLLVLEHDDLQGAATRQVAAETGFVAVHTQVDLNGIDRFLVAQKPIASKS
ncbi:MAG: peptide chain release factor N(5)-glutamine methyltransferase [Actinomycetaceae bacterium]|nr:peptide chain release factor N(5)-glutamine methyltransferase [Actinomycetaceae bacterium]